MYHAIVKRRLRTSFEEINRHNYAAIVRQFSTTKVEHWFSGASPLGGRRTTITDIKHWYDRLADIFPDLRFDITKLVVSGWPWNTVAFLEWTDYITDRQGQTYSNQGVHIITLTWGKVTELHVYCDTQLLSQICRTLAQQGNKAAAAAPIGTVGDPRRER